MRLHVRGEGQGLALVVARGLARGLGLVAEHRHAAGVDLEVHGAFTDADEGLAAVLDTLEVGAVAGDARDVVDFLALGDERLLILLGGGGLRVRGQRIRQEARAREGEGERHDAGDGTAHLAAALGLAAGHRRGLVVLGSGVIVFHLFPFESVRGKWMAA